MFDTRNTAKKAAPASITTTSHNLDKAKIRVVNLIDAARQVFIKADESDDKKIIPDLKRMNEHVYLYTPTIEGKKYRVFGVRHDRQEKIKFAELRQQIANELELKDVDSSVQIIGDSACFSHTGTAFARKELHEELDKNKKSIFYYGFTGNVNKDEDLADANQLVSEYLDDKTHGAERAQHFIANVVDQHTITAIKEWKCSISENISNLMLVYSNGDKPSIKFGGDIGLDPLTTKKGICLDGGVQSLLQIFNMLENDVEIQGVCQLRNPERKNFLSACHFISFLQKSIADLSAATEPTAKDISRLVDLYLQKYQPFDQKKGMLPQSQLCGMQQ